MREDLFELQIRGVEQDIIPYVGQCVLSNVPIERCIIQPYVHSLLEGSGEGMWLLIHNVEIVQCSTMT